MLYMYKFLSGLAQITMQYYTNSEEQQTLSFSWAYWNRFDEKYIVKKTVT